MELAPKTTLEGVQAWAVKTGYELGSHVYPRGYMVASKPIEGEPNKRDWRLVRWDRSKRRVDVLSESASLQTTAKYHLGMALAAHGISPNTKPEKHLQGVKFFPRAGV